VTRAIAKRDRAEDAAATDSLTRGIAVDGLTSPLVAWRGFFGNADLVTAYAAIITAVATGVWASRTT
jgi:hypothetical protein